MSATIIANVYDWKETCALASCLQWSLTDLEKGVYEQYPSHGW